MLCRSGIILNGRLPTIGFRVNMMFECVLWNVMNELLYNALSRYIQ